MSLSMTSSGQWAASHLLSPGVDIQCLSSTSLNKEVSYIYIYRYWGHGTCNRIHIKTGCGGCMCFVRPKNQLTVDRPFDKCFFFLIFILLFTFY